MAELLVDLFALMCASCNGYLGLLTLLKPLPQPKQNLSLSEHAEQG